MVVMVRLKYVLNQSKILNIMASIPDAELIVIKPLTAEDVIIEQQRLAVVDPNKLNSIYNDFSNAIMSILTTAARQTKDDEDIVELERMKRILNMTPSDEKFIRAKNKVWAVQNKILNKDAKFFIERDYSTTIKKDHHQAMIESLVEIVREQYPKLTPKEQEFYWKKAGILLSCVIRFRQLIGDFESD